MSMPIRQKVQLILFGRRGCRSIIAKTECCYHAKHNSYVMILFMRSDSDLKKDRSDLVCAENTLSPIESFLARSSCIFLISRRIERLGTVVRGR